MPDRGATRRSARVADLRDRVAPTASGRAGRAGAGDRRGRRRAPTSPTGCATATPIVIAFVLGLAFVLLLAAFRSLALAAAVIGLNLLSVGAAYGVLAAVFQHDWAEGLLGFTRRHGRRLAAAVRVRDPVRALDGLHDPRARADPRGAPRRALAARGGRRGRRRHRRAR